MLFKAKPNVVQATFVLEATFFKPVTPALDPPALHPPAPDRPALDRRTIQNFAFFLFPDPFFNFLKLFRFFSWTCVGGLGVLISKNVQNTQVWSSPDVL